MTGFIGKQALPPRPHLDHLRKQAKTRLAEMRSAEPGARLADAQHALAREYGFATWGLLRAEVLRLAGVADDRSLRIQRRLKPFRQRDREVHDAAMEQATHAESHTAFFLSGAATNIGVLFIIVAIVMALWVFTSALQGGPAAAQATALNQSTLEELAQQKAQRLAEQGLPRTAVAFDSRRFDAYAGIYQVDRYQFIAFTRDGDHFFGAPVDHEDQKLEFYPESPTKFFSKAAAYQIAFVPDAQGNVTQLIVHTKGFELPAPRVSEAVAKTALAELADRIRNTTPSPGTENALRRYIEAFQHGRPNYDEMIPIDRVQTYEQASTYGTYFRKWGALTSLTLAEVTPIGYDKYVAVLEHGRAEMTVDPLSPDGKTAGIRIGKAETR